MKRPAFQFYAADWRNNAKLRRCSPAARGVWMDVLCVLHDSDEYGVCRWPLVDLANSANAPIKFVRELVDKDVLKGADRDAAPYIYTPRHAGKDGEPVTLVEAGDGPCWYSSRFVRDEWVRQRRGASTQFTEDNQPPKKHPKTSPKPTIGDRQGDGTTSSSTSSEETSEANASAAVAAAKPVDKSPEDMAKAELWRTAVAVLQEGGCKSEDVCRSFMGKLVKDYGLEVVRDSVASAASNQPADAREYLKATCMRLKGERAADHGKPLTVPSKDNGQTQRWIAEHSAPIETTPEQKAAVAAQLAKVRASITAKEAA